jgi:hypothetical protein
VPGRPLIFSRQLDLAPGAMMALVEEELQAHSFRIIFATSETMVFRKRDLLGVVSGEMFGH